MAEADRLGRVAFLNTHGYDVARWLFVEHSGRLYDSKAIAGAALERQHGESYAQHRRGYTGGDEMVVPALQRLGFTIVDGRIRGMPVPRNNAVSP